jgi:hypothetical protein
VRRPYRAFPKDSANRIQVTARACNENGGDEIGSHASSLPLAPSHGAEFQLNTVAQLEQGIAGSLCSFPVEAS